MKTFTQLGFAVAIAMTSMLAGCELYFDGHDNDDHWNYCGSDGYYDCYGESCSWVSPGCPVGGGGTTEPGYGCQSNADCAAGCYCASGTCEEAGFCGDDTDCGPGYHCDTDRASCEPNPPQPVCTGDNDCSSGQICTNGACTSTCTCTNDSEATGQGYGYCDEDRNTCMTGSDPAGTCAGDVTCTTAAPNCAAGEVALILDGCYTGQCRAITVCGETPACDALGHESDCLNRATDCAAVYTGTGCHKPDGSACHAGDQNCTCSNFSFNSCEDQNPMARTSMVDPFSGLRVDRSYLQN